MRLLVLDNYDSFTYNLVHLIKELGYGDNMEVHRNDRISLDEVEQFDSILLSPGPGVPSEAGIMPALLKIYGSSRKILGVCLGHQAIAECYGAELYNMPEVFHGVTSEITIKKSEGFFNELPDKMNVCRYHSWAVTPESIPAELNVTAVDANGTIMAIKHKTHNVSGVQFHPESIMTEHGKKMMLNWLSR